MRHEIGVETMLFGRDFPHFEGTWPHTKDFLRIAFSEVPANEVELILGENAIRFLNLDRHRLAAIAKRIGPTMDEIIASGNEIRVELLASFNQRGGFLKPPERDQKIPMVDALLREDLDDLAGAGATI
jgi:hypothetical protein